MRKVLLCDAAFSAMPLLQALQDKGFHVGVCGGRAGDPGHALADSSFILDYSNVPALLALVQEEGFDYIVPGCTDVSYLCAAAVARTLNLPGFDTEAVSSMIHHKGLFRQHAVEHHYPIPRSATTAEAAAKLTFPLLIKPVDAYSGRGILKVIDPLGFDVMHQAMLESASGTVIFEEFKIGKLYSHSAFVRDGRILLDFFVNEYCTVFPYQVNSSNVETTLGAAGKTSMRRWLHDFVRDAGLCDGLLHTQFIYDGTEISLIETARRCPGDLYSLLVWKSTGIDYAALYVEPFCDLASVPNSCPDRVVPISRHTVSAREDCFYAGAQLAISAKSIEFIPTKTTGTYLRAAPFDRAGIYFIEHASTAAMEESTATLAEKVTILGRNAAGPCTLTVILEAPHG